MDIDPEAEEALRYRAKKALRQRARALRNTVPPGALAERSARIVQTLAGLPEIAAARTVALFDPIEGRNEVDLRALDAELRARGVAVAYPAIDPETSVMTFRFVDDPAVMEEQGLGFREPPAGSIEAAALDVVVVPALQVDPRGYRLGYGAGYYDRTLPRFCPPTASVCVAFDFQLVSELPCTAGDVPVDAIVTDARTMRVER